MSAMLGKALEGLGLQPGHTYRAVVEGHVVEVRVLDDNSPTPELAEQVMMNIIVDVPRNPAGRAVARPGKLPPPDPPVIPAEETEAAE